MVSRLALWLWLLSVAPAWAYQVPVVPKASGEKSALDGGAAPDVHIPAVRPPVPPPRPAPPLSKQLGSFPSKTFGAFRVVQVPHISNEGSSHGYITYRFVVYNKSKKSKQVSLVLKGRRSAGYHLREVKVEREIPAGGRAWLVLMHQRINMSGRLFQLWADGKKVGTFAPADQYHLQDATAYKRVHLLVGRDIPSDVKLSVDRALRLFRKYNRNTRRRVYRRWRYRRYRYYRRYRRYRRYRGYWGRYRRRWSGTPPKISREIRRLLNRNKAPFVSFSYHWGRASLPTTQWPRQWLSYTRFDGVLVNPFEWKQMPSTVRTALRRFVEAGGTLVVTGRCELPKGWRGEEVTRRGAWRRFFPGFGAVFVHQERFLQVPKANIATFWRPVLRSVYRSALPMHKRMSPSEADHSFSIVGDLKVPARGIFALMLLFVVLIGPLNFWLLSRMDRRLWTLWTIPAMAFVTCALLFLYASLSEGWGGHARSSSITILDQRHQRASTIGWLGFYLPLTPSDGLRFAGNSELIPQFAIYGALRGLRMDWSKEQGLREGWSVARLPLHFRYRRAERRQEKLVVRVKGDKLVIVNGLGARIERLWLLGPKGRRFEVNGLEAGARKTLSPTSSASSSVFEPLSLRSVFSATRERHDTRSWGQETEWLKQVGQMASEPWRYLRKGRYIAELKKPVFIDRAVGRRAYVRAKSIVYGILEKPNGS